MQSRPISLYPVRFALFCCVVLATDGNAVDRRALLVAGPPSHGPGAHEHNAGVLLMQKCLLPVEGLKVDVALSGWPKDESLFEGVHALVMYCDGGVKHLALADIRLGVLCALARRGVGIGCIHYAVEPALERGHAEFLQMIGGAFEIQWSVNPHWTAAFTSHGDYHELLARSDIDAVVISTPDHWHAEPALAAVPAGKDVYLQKPMTMTHAEGNLLRDAVAKSGRIFQLGSQQRSNDQQFRRACEFVRSGRVGRVLRVEIGLPVDPTAPDEPAQPVPAHLDFDRWLGSTPLQPYTEQRVRPTTGYDRPGWLRNDAYCLGMITGWGAHHYDILHWALDVELGGPSRVEGRADFPKNTIWNVHGAYDIELTYPGGVKVAVSDKLPNGLRFIGDEGWIFVSRGSQPTKDPTVPRGRLKPLHANDERLLDPKGMKVELPRSSEHHLNWLEGVRARRTPLVPVPVAHRSNAACIVSWVAMKLGRPLTWDAVAERFVDDVAANALLVRPERAPYGATRLAGKLARA